MSLVFFVFLLVGTRNMEEEKRNSSNIKKEENQLIQVTEKFRIFLIYVLFHFIENV